ncbi:NfeD family protein [Paenibacillus flagellatus]|uniref:Serine protease n=1 Tax=Paenibacillus flagellatus TaxID=2211139 RepID=A0A2V5JY17_9BACL|nr:nodulation protein NfeD [Paenibacillus flagellatus]PYI51765.1 serine protease [Paenibacillus flagellatus]
MSNRLSRRPPRPMLLALALVAVVLAGGVLLGIGVQAASSGKSSTLAESLPASSGKLVYVVPVKQTVESGLQRFLERAFAEAIESAASLVVLDIDTLGGRLDSAEQIGELIRTSPIPTAAFVNGRAVSAGSYIALNAETIVMTPGSTLGAAAVVDGAGNEVESAKVVSHWASEMRAAAELRGRNPAIAEGMVDKNAVVDMPPIGRTAGKGEIVSLSAEEAVKVGYAEKIADTLDEAIAFLGMKGATVVEFEPSGAEKLARFLVHPVVMTVLLLVGIAGVAIELLVPGFGLPGILGLTGFALYFFGHYVAGFAGIEHIVLFVAGVVLLVAEMFVPSFGLLGVLGIVSIIGGVVMAAFDTGHALLSLGISTVLAAVVVYIVARLFKRRGIWNKFILRDELKSELGYVSHDSKEHLFGALGTSVTPLRPAGTAEFWSERVDVETDGEFVEPGRAVQVVKIEGNRVVVKPV